MQIEWWLKIKNKSGWCKKNKKIDWNTSFNKNVYPKSVWENKNNTVI